MLDLDAHLPLIAAGDRDAFGAWAAGAEHLLRDALRRFAGAADVEAVLQEALLRAWQVAPRVRPDDRPNSLLRLALRAAHNLAVSEARRARRLVREGDDELERWLAVAEGPGPAPPDPLLRRLVLACRDLLPPQPRRALDARLEAGGAGPDQSLAARLGMRLNTFLQNVTRARRLLAECLARHGVDLEEERP